MTPFTEQHIRKGSRHVLFSLLVAGALTFTSVPGDPARAAELSVARGSATQTATCTNEVGPALPPPTVVRRDIPGYHAAPYGQTGYPTLCPGATTTVVMGFLNTGTLGWYRDVPGQAALLGTWGPEPGQDRPSVLGGADTGWPAPNRVAIQPAAYVGPGQVAWFQFTVRAPAAPGVYRLALRPVIEGTQWMEDLGAFWYVTVKTSDAVASQAPAPAPARTYFPAIMPDGSRSIRVPVLMYHYVGPLPADADRFRVDLTVSPSDFEEQLRYLRATGHNAITTTDLWWALDTGNPLPANPVVLTFDDGYVGQYEHAFPLLQKYGMVGTFAVTLNLVDTPGYMTRAMIRALADGGMDLQSHLVDHFSLNRLSYGDQLYQACVSRRILQDWTGKEVRHLVYPAGDYWPIPARALTECGYLTAYRKDGGSSQSSNAMYALKRYRVRGQQGLGTLLTALGQ